MWGQRIKDMLIKVVLYQHGKYPAEKLDKELAEFLRDAEKTVCEAIRRNGGVCYKEALEEMTPGEARGYVEDQIKNFEMLGKTGKIVADLLRLSLEFKDLDKMSLRDKILLFDKVVHAEHTAGAFKEYLAEEKSIFGVDITKIKEEADKEVEEILKGRKGVPDPPEEITIPGLPNVQQLIRYAKVLGAWQLGLYPPNILWFMDSSRVSVGFTEVPSIKVDKAIMFELPIARKSDADKIDRIEIKGKKAYFVIGGRTIDVEVEESTFDLSPLLEMPKKRHEFGWLDLRDGKDVLSEMRLMKFSEFGNTVAIDFYNGVFAVTDYDDIPGSKDVIERLVKRGQFYDLWKATFELQDFYVNVSVPSLSAIRSSYLDDIVKELKNPLLIYMSPVVDLFGPIVFLTARKDSDYDVYIIVAPVVLGEPIEEYYKRYHELPKNVRDFLSIYPDLAEKVEEDWKKLERRVEELIEKADEILDIADEIQRELEQALLKVERKEVPKGVKYAEYLPPTSLIRRDVEELGRVRKDLEAVLREIKQRTLSFEILSRRVEDLAKKVNDQVEYLKRVYNTARLINRPEEIKEMLKREIVEIVKQYHGHRTLRSNIYFDLQKKYPTLKGIDVYDFVMEVIDELIEEGILRRGAEEGIVELAKLPTERRLPIEELWREAEELKKKYEEAEKHFRKPSIKEYYDWLEKAGRLGWVQEAIRRAKEVRPDIVTDLLMWELIYRALDRKATKEDLVRYAEEWAKRVKEEAEKKKVVEEKSPVGEKKPTIKLEEVLDKPISKPMIVKVIETTLDKAGIKSPKLRLYLGNGLLNYILEQRRKGHEPKIDELVNKVREEIENLRLFYEDRHKWKRKIGSELYQKDTGLTYGWYEVRVKELEDRYEVSVGDKYFFTIPKLAREELEEIGLVPKEKPPVEEKPPTPPKPPEKPFFELAKKLAIEKLTLFTKAKALELGFSVEEANRIVQDMKDELTLLGTGIVTGDTTQEAAEREIEEGLRNLKRKREEEKRKKTEEERKRVSREREDVLKRMRQEIERTLKREGYTRVTTALKEIAYDLEDLAESVVEGWLSFDEAVERGVRLARQYATPPKPPKAPPAVPRVEKPPVEVPRRPFLSAEEAADIIWKEYLGDLFNFGIRYVFENYLRERGMLEQDLGRVAYRLASKVRLLGQRMRREGEEEGVGRYIWASYALTRYAPEIVQFGLLWAMRKIVPEIWPELRLFRNVVEALRRTGIEGCTAKALVGVVYDYAGIPRNKWPEDVIQCYEAFVEAAERPPEVRRRPLWELFE